MGVMVQSLAAQHRAQVEAGNTHPATATSKPASVVNRLMLASLQADYARLKNVRSRRRKADIKRELLPKYADHLSSILNRSSSGHDETLVVLCVWALDAGDWHTALMLAAFALEHGMKAPEGFKRGLPETLLEEAAIQAKQQGYPSDLRHHLLHLQALTSGADIADEVTAKFNKALGQTLEPTDAPAALHAYRTAEQYGAHVKRNINRIERGLQL